MDIANQNNQKGLLERKTINILTNVRTHSTFNNSWSNSKAQHECQKTVHSVTYVNTSRCATADYNKSALRQDYFSS